MNGICINNDVNDDLIHGRNSERDLLRNLSSGYFSPSARPVRNHKEPVEVKVQIALIDVIKLDEASGCVTFKLWLSTSWKDDFLSWNASQLGIKRVNIPTEKAFVWLPDIVLFNSLETRPTDPGHPEAVCYHTGDIFWVRPIVTTVPARYEFKSNSWTSGLKIGSWTYGLNFVDLRPIQGEGEKSRGNFIEVRHFSGSDRWELLNMSSHRRSTMQECCQELQVSVHIVVRFKKKTRIN